MVIKNAVRVSLALLIISGCTRIGLPEVWGSTQDVKIDKIMHFEEMYKIHYRIESDAEIQVRAMPELIPFSWNPVEQRVKNKNAAINWCSKSKNCHNYDITSEMDGGSADTNFIFKPRNRQIN